MVSTFCPRNVHFHLFEACFKTSRTSLLQTDWEKLQAVFARNELGQNTDTEETNRCPYYQGIRIYYWRQNKRRRLILFFIAM